MTGSNLAARRSGGPFWIIFLLWAFVTGLNLLKPFHIDDTAYLLIAEWITQSPFHPMSGAFKWLDTTEPIFVTNQPHLFFYLMAGMMALAGPSELVMHLLLSVFTLALLWGTYLLALINRPIEIMNNASIGELAVWSTVMLFVFGNDLRFAMFYRDTVPEAVAMAAAFSGLDNTVYTRGHWGWQWYARETEMVEFDSARSTLNVGDILVDPTGISAQKVVDFQNYEIVGSLVPENSLFTLIDTHSFYASGISSTPLLARNNGRKIQIWRKRE